MGSGILVKSSNTLTAETTSIYLSNNVIIWAVLAGRTKTVVYIPYFSKAQRMFVLPKEEMFSTTLASMILHSGARYYTFPYGIYLRSLKYPAK